MRVRVYRAFSGNNSGSYALVGTFREASQAAALADELREVLREHDAWLASDAEDLPAASPLAELARRHGIDAPDIEGADDDWPQYGNPPQVVASGAQLLVFVDYCITFSRTIGEIVYRRGGRVSVEVNHGHDPLVLVHLAWYPDGWRPERKETAERARDAFASALRGGALAHLYERAEGPPPPPPIVRTNVWQQVTLVHVPVDPVAALRAVDELARAHDLMTRLELFEAPVSPEHPDPLRAFRGFELERGGHQLVLWRPGQDAIATLRAVRTVTGLDVAEASELVAKAPIELLVDVSEREAKDAEKALLAAGAEVEVLAPEQRRRG